MTAEGASKPSRLPFSTKALYGSGTIAFGIKDQGFSALLMLYYNQVVGLPATWVGAAIMVAMIADALFDPLLGQISDDFRSKWGRRHPFMYAAVVPIGLFYFLLWQPPQWSNEDLFFYLLAVSIAVRWAISLYEIPSTALLAEFSTDYHERTTLVAHRYFFGVAGGLTMGIVAFGVFFKPDAAHPIGHLNPAGYFTYALVSAVAMSAFVLLSTWGTHDRIPSLRVPEHAPRLGLVETVRNMVGVIFHPMNASVLFASLFLAMSSGLSASLNVYFATYLWGLSSEQIATLTASAFVGIVLAFVVVLPLSAVFGKKGTAMALYLLALVSGAAPLTLRLLGHFPPNGDPLLLPLLMANVALFATSTIAASILAVSMIADVTDQVQLTTGRQSEGLLFSAATMVNKAVSGMGVFVSGLVLAAVAFPANAVPGAVSEATLSNLAVIQIAATTTLSLLAIFCLSYYPITKSHHQDAVQKLGKQPG